MKPNNRADFWNKLKTNWYKRGLKHSDMSKTVLSRMLPRLEDIDSILDVGSGPGTLTIPLALQGKNLTALDPSVNMLSLLNEAAKAEGAENITTIEGSWDEPTLAALKKHDAIICANVPELLRDNLEFLKEVNELAEKMVVLIMAADPAADKFFYKELYPLLLNKTFEPRNDYLSTYSNLHSLGIYANIDIIEYDFDQPFDDLDEAVEFWREYMGFVTGEHDETLRVFLEKKLVKTDDGLLAKFHKKSAIMWWEK